MNLTTLYKSIQQYFDCHKKYIALKKKYSTLLDENTKLQLLNKPKSMSDILNEYIEVNICASYPENKSTKNPFAPIICMEVSEADILLDVKDDLLKRMRDELLFDMIRKDKVKYTLSKQRRADDTIYTSLCVTFLDDIDVSPLNTEIEKLQKQNAELRHKLKNINEFINNAEVKIKL